MDDTDFDLLCKGLSADEAKRMRKVVKEWCDDDKNGFPVQLVLLTCAQLRAAASVPRATADSRKWLEQHLAEYRRQTQSLLDGFNKMIQTETHNLGTSLSLHANKIENAARQIQARHEDAEFVAGCIKSLMEQAAHQWEFIKADTREQCKQLEVISNELQNRCSWRVLLEWVTFFLLVSGISFLAGHYVWSH